MELVVLLVFAFFAGFVDSVVGGGGLIQMPVFFVLYPQLSVANLISTNRLASVVGTSVAAVNYMRQVSLPWRAIVFAILGAIPASYFGASLQSKVPQEILKPLILCVIIGIAIFSYVKKDLGSADQIKISETRLPFWAAGMGMVLGFYNGMFGPGTGTLLVFGFVGILGYNFLRASGAGKIVNAAADFSSLIFFLLNGMVIFKLALPMMACNVAGAYLGSKMAMLRGNAWVRRIFLIVMIGVILRFAWDVLAAGHR